ncbi:MAG: class V aminotransferase, partial [Nevskiales bacterium]
LQEHFLDGIERLGLDALKAERLIPRRGSPRGNFLCFRNPQAADCQARLQARNVMADYREDRLRLGFGIYHDATDIDELLHRCMAALA